jgi:uncharacterized protein (UPF0335 family)
MKNNNLSQLRKRIEKLSEESTVMGDLAKAIRILNDSLQEHIGKIEALEKDVKALKRRPSGRS